MSSARPALFSNVEVSSKSSMSVIVSLLTGNSRRLKKCPSASTRSAQSRVLLNKRPGVVNIKSCLQVEVPAWSFSAKINTDKCLLLCARSLVLLRFELSVSTMSKALTAGVQLVCWCWVDGWVARPLRSCRLSAVLPTDITASVQERAK